MKILKPGKVEQRKFICPKCGCEFVADEDDILDGYVKCPQSGCGYYLDWEHKGEPYEEPVEDHYVTNITYCNNMGCPFKDCTRHITHTKNYPPETIVTIADYGSTCRQYVNYMIEDLDKSICED